MLDTVFVTKLGMMQAWSDQGKRLAVTKCKVGANLIVSTQKTATDSTRGITEPETIVEIGYGKKKLKNVPKSLRSKIEKAGFKQGVTQISGVKIDDSDDEVTQESFQPGKTIEVDQVLEVGDVVKVQGISKGRGFAGAMKRHGFHGGPATHGQSDRARAVGSIGAGTDPGRVWKGKKMPGHFGVDAKTVLNLVVLHIDSETNEVWLSGPVPGHKSSTLRIIKTGKKKNLALDLKAMGMEKPVVEENEKDDKKAEKPAEGKEA